MSPFAQPILRGFVLCMVVGIFAYLVILDLITDGLNQVDATVGVLSVQTVAILPLIWLLWKHLNNKLPLKYFFRQSIKPFSKVNLCMIWLTLMILSLGIEGLTNLFLSSVVPAYIEDALSEQIIDPASPLMSNILTLILAVIIGPVMEEFVFRGLLMQRLSVKFNPNLGILLSSFLFGILHFESWLSATIFGIVMCLIFIKSKNLWLPIVMHIINNSAVVVMDLLEYRDQKLERITELQDFFWYYFLALIVAPILFLMARQLWPDKMQEIPYDNNLKLAS
ncbi:MAG: CPBP family intramembrane metalloprotease [Saprospiraceae bacterium]|nr:CPBP family intramembrane metalloprotease [Saprospiraceae bacterium]